MHPKTVFFLILGFFSLQILNSQITSSPYTMFGAGQLEDKGFGINKALGSTGIAFKSKNSLNNINPASYSSIDSLSFLFEFGLFSKYTRYSTNNDIQDKLDGNIRYLAMGFRFAKKWTGSIGIVPYSSVGYSIKTTDNIKGELTEFNKNYSGSGGINQFYFGNSFLIGKNLSAGINASLIFGSITQTETISSNDKFDGFSIQNKKYVNNFYLDYGLQYTIPVHKWDYTLGIIYGNMKKLNTSNDIILNTYDNTSTINTDSKQVDFFLPQKYGFGIAATHGCRFRTGIDYERKNWSVIDFSNPLLKTKNSDRFSFGIEYTPNKSYKDAGLKKLYYRMGANYNSSYLEIDNTPVISRTLTFGVGIPLKYELSTINISFEYGQNGTKNNDLIKENYYLVNFNMTLHDLWFIKQKIQ